MKHKYKKKVKIASAVALSTAMMVNSAGSIFAENEKQTEEYSVESYGEKVETTAEDIPITEEYFPDETFRNFVKEQFDTDKNDILEKVELDAVTKISFFHIDANKVETLKGIEHFQNLEEVRAEYKSFAMEEADFSKNPKLKKLIFTGSDVKRVNVSGTQVNYLDLTRSKNLEVINLGENPSAHFEEFRIAAAPNLREIIGFDKIEGMTSLNMEQMYYEKGHSNYGVYEVGIKGFDLTHIRVDNLRLSAGSHVEMPMTLAWLHLGDTTGGFIYLNKNKDSVVEIDKKGTPLAECDTDLEFKIQDKFPGMDPSRAWVLEENGLSYNKTTGEVIRTSPEVKYQYDCGTWNGATIWLNVTLRFTPYNNIFNPQANRITISKGEALPDATTAIANLADMPEDTTFNWRGSIDTNTVGVQTGSIRVTYPDGTKENIDVTVNVVDGDVSDADRYNPVVNTAGITTYKDEIPTSEKIKEAITNANTFPENTTYAWKSIDVSTLGETTGIATVTYPDRSTDEVEIKVNVIEYNPGNNADIYEAETKQITLDQGVVPDNAQIEEGIVNKDALPVGTKYEWQEVDTATPGEKEAKIKVVYPDGSVDENVVMPVRVKHYNEMYEPEVNPAGITTTQGETPSVEKIKEAITNANTLPEGTTYSWKSLDVTTVGKTTGIATVSYPDGSVDEVSIEVLVEKKEENPGTGGDENKPSNPDEPSNPNEPTDPTLPEEPTQPENPSQPSNPTQPEGSIEGVQTGDASQAGLWTAIMGGSVGILAYLKRKKKNFHI